MQPWLVISCDTFPHIIMLYSAEMQEMREMGGIRITRCTEGLKTKPTAFNTEL